jgi:hypothetical protein
MSTDIANNASPTKFRQMCIEADCRSSFDLDERMYVCRRCGGLLDIERSVIVDY